MTKCHRAWQIQTGQTDWSAVKVDCVLSEERDLLKTNKTTHLHRQPAIDKGDAKQRTSIRFGFGAKRTFFLCAFGTLTPHPACALKSIGNGFAQKERTV